MPSIITHSVVGIVSASIFKTNKFKIKFLILSIICPILPDLDVIAFKFGIPYEHFLGHRGFFHSLTFAFLLGLIVVLLFFRSKEIRFKGKVGLLIYFFLLTASHGILDAFTSGGLGIALLSPFDTTRYFFPYTPIKVSPLGITAFFSDWGKQVMISEMRWVWLPLIIIGIMVKIILRMRYNKKTT